MISEIRSSENETDGDWVGVGMGERGTQLKAPSRVSSTTLAPEFLALNCRLVTSASQICSLRFTGFTVVWLHEGGDESDRQESKYQLSILV